MASSVASAVYLLCDRFFLARHSESALGAVLPAGMLANVLTTVVSVTIGYSATFIAQFHSAGKNESAARSFASGMHMTILSAPLFLLAIPSGICLLKLSGHEQTILAEEIKYFSIVQPSGFLAVVFAVSGGLLTGQGHTLHFGFAATIGALTNIALDRLLILGWGPLPALGITGAGLATLVAQAVQCAILTPRVFRDPLLRALPLRAMLVPKPRLIAEIFKFGLSNGCCALVSTATFALFTLKTAKLDSISLAASNVAFAINGLYYPILSSVTFAVTILSGRHKGASNFSGIRSTLVHGMLLSYTLLGGLAMLIFAFHDFWIRHFSTSLPATNQRLFASLCITLLLILSIRELAETALNTLSAILRGAGDTKYVMLMQSGVELLVWCPAVLTLSAKNADIVALWLTMPLSFGLTAILLFLRWKSKRWRNIHLAEFNADQEAQTPKA